MALIKTVAKRCQLLLTAAFGVKSNYADYDYIINWINIRNLDINNRFQALGLDFDTQVVVLPNVPANTTDLSSYQADGGLLSNLVIPDSTDGSSPLEWRLAGGSDLDWQGVPWVGKVLDTNTADEGNPVASESAYVGSFEWRGGIVYISPCNQIVDLRLRGDFVPNFAGDDAAQTLAKGIINVLAYWTCESIAKYAPGGEASSVAKAFNDDAKAAENDWVCMMAKAQQGMPIRLGGRRTQWGGSIGPFTVPIVN